MTPLSCILSKENTFYLERTHSIQREHIRSKENTFYLKVPAGRRWQLCGAWAPAGPCPRSRFCRKVCGGRSPRPAYRSETIPLFVCLFVCLFVLDRMCSRPIYPETIPLFVCLFVCLFTYLFVYSGVGDYASGGSGLLFSNGFLQAAWRHLGPFAASWRR